MYRWSVRGTLNLSQPRSLIPPNNLGGWPLWSATRYDDSWPVSDGRNSTLCGHRAARKPDVQEHVTHEAPFQSDGGRQFSSSAIVVIDGPPQNFKNEPPHYPSQRFPRILFAREIGRFTRFLQCDDATPMALGHSKYSARETNQKPDNNRDKKCASQYHLIGHRRLSRLQCCARLGKPTQEPNASN